MQKKIESIDHAEEKSSQQKLFLSLTKILVSYYKYIQRTKGNRV